MVLRQQANDCQIAGGRRRSSSDHERSLPMFREQVGFLGVFFAKSAPERAVITLWRDQDDVRRLEESPTYRQTVEQIIQAGILDGASDVEVLVTHGYELATVMLNSDEMR